MSERKELLVYSQGYSYKIKYAGGGELPEELKGLYTSTKAANFAIEKYLAKRDGDKDGSDKAKRGNKQI